MSSTQPSIPPAQPQPAAEASGSVQSAPPRRPGEVAEIGGPKGLEPTRYGDWERNGRCSDF